MRFVDEDRRRAPVLYVEALGNEALNRRRIETGHDVLTFVERDTATATARPPRASTSAAWRRPSSSAGSASCSWPGSTAGSTSRQQLRRRRHRAVPGPGGLGGDRSRPGGAATAPEPPWAAHCSCARRPRATWCSSAWGTAGAMVRLRSAVRRWRTERMVRRAVRSIDGDLELLLAPAADPAAGRPVGVAGGTRRSVRSDPLRCSGPRCRSVRGGDAWPADLRDAARTPRQVEHRLLRRRRCPARSDGAVTPSQIALVETSLDRPRPRRARRRLLSARLRRRPRPGRDVHRRPCRPAGPVQRRAGRDRRLDPLDRHVRAGARGPSAPAIAATACERPHYRLMGGALLAASATPWATGGRPRRTRRGRSRTTSSPRR